MKWIVIAAVLAISGSALGQGDYEAWVENEFPAAYLQVQRCLPMTVRWQAQSGDPVEAEIWRDGTDTYLRSEMPTISANGTRASETITLVDAGSDGQVNRAIMKGESVAGSELEEYPMIALMLHTTVAVATHTGQCRAP